MFAIQLWENKEFNPYKNQDMTGQDRDGEYFLSRSRSWDGG